MKVVVQCNRSSYVGDIDSDSDDPKLTMARLLAKLEQHKDKVMTINASPDIEKILAVINPK